MCADVYAGSKGHAKNGLIDSSGTLRPPAQHDSCMADLRPANCSAATSCAQLTDSVDSLHTAGLVKSTIVQAASLHTTKLIRLQASSDLLHAHLALAGTHFYHYYY